MKREDRFRLIYKAHYHRVLGYTLRRTKTSQDAADIVAETFLTAWRKIEEVPGGNEARLWLYAVARRALANHHRGEQRRERLRASMEADWPLRDQWASSRGERLHGVAEAFGRLRPEERDLLGLISWEGLTYEELASVLHCSVNAARIRVHRARQRLRLSLLEMGIEVKHRGTSGHTSNKGQKPVPALEEEA